MTASKDTLQASRTPAGPLTLDDIASGRNIAVRESGPDVKDKLEASDIEQAMLRARLNDLTSMTTLRVGYEKKVFWYLVFYSLAAFALLMLSGFGYIHLPENVLLAVAGSTALSAIGLVAQIGKGLFGDQKAP